MKLHIESVVVIILLSLLFTLCSCDDGWGPGGPTQAHLHGDWKLDSAVSNHKRVNSQKEVLNIAWDGKYTAEKTFHNDSLVNTQYWSIDPRPASDDRNSTVLITYRYGLRRFYKVRAYIGEPYKLEATAYLNQVGGEADSVKYYYTEIR